MNIVGFGDSFILGLADIVPGSDQSTNLAWKNSYQGMLGDHYKCVPEFRGFPGTGPWSMFFDFLNYKQKDKIDVAIIAWSEITRLYHPKLQVGNITLFDKERMNTLTEDEKIVLSAAKGYIQHLGNTEKLNYEMKALMMLVDDMAKSYPNIKFIHLPCFTWENFDEWWNLTYKKKKPSDLKYYHDFKNGMEVRPALMYMSMMDEWPSNPFEDKRECHLSSRVNRLLADKIIDCIENYHPGKLLQIDVSLIK